MKILCLLLPSLAAAATANWEKACDAGRAEACGNLGVEYAQKGDLTRAISFYSLACDLGDEARCLRGGVLALRGEKPDGKEAARLFARGCRGGEALSCGNLHFLAKGKRLEEGGGLKDLPGARTEVPAADLLAVRPSLEKACAKKNAAACYHLGLLRAAGELGNRDLSGAIQAYGQACEGKEGAACVAAAHLTLEKIGATGGRENALRFLFDGCRLQADGACAEHAKLKAQQP
jgi:TPR repeat protein